MVMQVAETTNCWQYLPFHTLLTKNWEIFSAYFGKKWKGSEPEVINGVNFPLIWSNAQNVILEEVIYLMT
jgi:hypothetical protein